MFLSASSSSDIISPSSNGLSTGTQLQKHPKKNKSIEAKLIELEEILEDLESGKLELDDALKKFEKGIKLSRECQQTLEEAEMKIQVLMEDELKDSDETLT